ncbi:MAG: hypothetical protein HGA60_06720 [Chlorobiaceae bacterium]|nr:hypothetical protein [Chlorobiaceae bacterium]
MAEISHLTMPSSPSHYIVAVHGMGEQKLNTTIPPIIHRFAEIRQNKPEGYFDILLPASQSSQSVLSETELHGWSEFRGIPIEDKEIFEDFDGTPPTITAGENFRFVELYWQDILERHQQKFASSTEEWVRAMIKRLENRDITYEEWLPVWAIPMLKSIVNIALPLKKFLGIKYAPLVTHIFDGFLGDVHLYGDFAQTRGEAVRHFHAELDKLIFLDFIDWRKREIAVSKLNREPLVPGHYLPPKITIIAHSLGSIMSFDALVYAFAKKEIRQLFSDNSEYSSSFPFWGYTTPMPEEADNWKTYDEKLNRVIDEVEDLFILKLINKIREQEYKPLLVKIYETLSESDMIEADKDDLLYCLNCELDEALPIKDWLAERISNNHTKQHIEDTHHLTHLLFCIFEESIEIHEPDSEITDKIKNKINRLISEDRRKFKLFVREKLGGDKELLQSVKNILDENFFIQKHLTRIAFAVAELKKNYWKHFSDGFTDIQDQNISLLNQKSPSSAPEVNEKVKSDIPLLLWRKGVKNFITLGSPIDKFVALWSQNYLHLGLKIKDYTNPSRWELPFGCQYDYPESLDIRKINHYNFCDEQDPVGHHLDLTRRTTIYEKLFDTLNRDKRDIVFRRYNIPGFAHNKYWEDGKLFRGILCEILDRKEAGTSSYFSNDEFRDKKKAEQQSILWAYFRIPLYISIITGLIISYAISAEIKPFTRVTIWIAAIILWIMPRFMAYQKERVKLDNSDKSTARIFFTSITSFGVFPNIIKIAIEWRRILLTQSQGDLYSKDESSHRMVFQTGKERWVTWPFVWRWIMRTGTAVILCVLFWASDIAVTRDGKTTSRAANVTGGEKIVLIMDVNDIPMSEIPDVREYSFMVRQKELNIGPIHIPANSTKSLKIPLGTTPKETYSVLNAILVSLRTTNAIYILTMLFVLYQFFKIRSRYTKKVTRALI